MVLLTVGVFTALGGAFLGLSCEDQSEGVPVLAKELDWIRMVANKIENNTSQVGLKGVSPQERRR